MSANGYKQMLYVDLPTKSEFSDLRSVRRDACVSIYLPTSPISQEAGLGRTELVNQFRIAGEQLDANGFNKRLMAELTAHIDDLHDDDEFWRLQANSLAVLASPDSLRTYRLANKLTPMVMVSDRFHLSPLMRALTFPNAAFVLHLSENAARLIEVHPDLTPSEVKVPGMPRDAASAVHKSTLNDRAPSGRIQGAEGQNVRLRQYARQVDAALRFSLAGRTTPLILSAADRMASIYRSVNHYPNLVGEHISNTTDRTTNDEFAKAARRVLDELNTQRVEQINELFKARAIQGMATDELSDTARAATFGAIDTLLVDMDANVPGTIDEQTGALELAREASSQTYDVADEISARALARGGEVLSVRAADMPGDAPVAALLRFRI